MNRFLILLAAVGSLAAAPAKGEPQPSIVVYERARHARDEAFALHQPKAFWVRSVYKSVIAAMTSPSLHASGAGTVRLGFAVARDGNLLSARVVESSGNTTLDKATLALLTKAAPFAPMPEGLKEAQMAFDVPVRVH